MFEKDDNSDVTRFEKLKADIKELQSKGVLVKLSYGGEEWGNTDLLGTYQGRVIHQSDFLNELLHFYLISIKKFSQNSRPDTMSFMQLSKLQEQWKNWILME